MHRSKWMGALLISMLAAAAAANASPVNLAINQTRTGYPNPTESDRGWGGGSDPWEIVDGIAGYPDTWAHGLAFTGGHLNSSGGPPYLEPAGIRQATINFGAPVTFDTVVVWHHGAEYTARDPWLDYWDGSTWVPLILTTHVYPAGHADGAGYSEAELFGFSPVTGSKVRYSMDNRQFNVLNTYNIHGWINEFEVFNNSPVPEPGTIYLGGMGLGLLMLGRLRRFRRRRCQPNG